MSISNDGENLALAAFPSPMYVKMHIGDPGEDCTSNAAGNTLRKSVTFGAAASGTRTSTSAADWTTVGTAEVYTHISLWSAVSAGTAYWSGALTAQKSVGAADNFSIPTGNITVSID